MAKLQVTEHNGKLFAIPYGSNKSENDLSIVYLVKPKFAFLYLTGTLPTDQTDSRTPTTLSFYIEDKGKVVYEGKVELSIQGHGSTAYTKKNYTFDVVDNEGESVKIKFGDFVASDSFHLKAYATDTTHARDCGNFNLWRGMIHTLEYPYCKVNNKPFALSASVSENGAYIADSKYAPDGFPMCVYLNGAFFGLYTMRLKKTRENYALDKSNKNEIFLDSSTYTAFFSQSFDYTDWDLKNPKLSGYSEGGQITDSAVLANINRLFEFTKNLSTRSSEYADYLVLKHWIVWVIFSELVSNRDTCGNNYNVVTWDATHWSIIPYDLDLTLGLNAWSNYSLDSSRSSMDIASANVSGSERSWWDNFKNIFSNEIKTMYTNLRGSGFLTMGNIEKYYIDQVREIPREVYTKDANKWGCIWSSVPTIEHLLKVLESRIEYLDSVWLLNG